MKHLNQIIELTAKTGETLLKHGAEISRVEETMTRIANHYQVDRFEIFIITNGIFISLGMGEEEASHRVRYVPEVSVDLNKIALVNDMSRSIEQGRYSVGEALKEIERINKQPIESRLVRILASGIGSGGFCILFGGDIHDCIGAFVNGLLLYIFVVLVEDRRMSKVLWYAIGGALVSMTSVWMYRAGLTTQLDKTIIGSIIPLIPGVAFVNGVRELADGDYLSGGIRLLDAIIKTICIAVGVGVALRLGGMA